MSEENYVACDCGCKQQGYRNRMVTVTTEFRTLSENQLRTRAGKRWDVLPECEAPFKRELNAAAILKQLAEEGAGVSWWKRAFAAPLVFFAQRLYMRRKSTAGKSFVQSFKVAAVFGTPERVSEWLGKRWAPKPPPGEEAFVPTVVPSSPCGPS